MATSTPYAAGDDAPVLSLSASTIAVAALARGYHVLNIDGYSRTKEAINTGTRINSCTFEVGGYTWCIRYYINGITQDCADCISVYLDLVDPIDGVDTEFQIALLDGGGRAAPPHRYKCQHTFKKHEEVRGWRRFITREELENSDHLRKDCFTIRCDLTVLKELRVQEPAAEESFVEVPPSNMHRHLGDLLYTRQGADVTFKIGRREFSAHRYVLAARSPVFKAELFGSMKEKTARSIRIDDMDADVFEALLHFIYTDELPEINEEDAVVVAQHLLVAADRYDMERLRLMCEDQLCRRLDVKTAATTLALAEQHRCHGLKKAIFRFLSLPQNMKAVMATDGYDHLMTSCPSVCKELVAKLVDLLIDLVT